MYFIYADEAGTSVREQVTVVVGVILHADRHWRDAANMLQEILDEYVPKPLRPGFIFHAKDVWSGYRDYDGIWSRDQRVDLISAVASIPRFLEAAVALGKVRRDSSVPPQLNMPLEDFQHAMAFWFCISRANKYVRDWADPNEVTTLVAEDVPKKRKILKKSIRSSYPDIPLNEQTVILTAQDKAAGRVMQTSAGNVDRVVDTVHFVEKDEAPLLQLADACAFSFRRYFAGQSHGDQLVTAMLGSPLIWEEWQGPSSQMTFSFDPNHRYPL